MALKKIKTQVIIIGAGPAGATTSIFLSKARVSHIIIEKEKFPRDKVCGDACSGRTAFVIRQADPKWLQEIFEQTNAFMPVHGALFFVDNKSLSIPFSRKNVATGHAAGFTAPRLTFDNFLFSKITSAYSSVFQHASLQSIERLENGFVKVVFDHATDHLEVTAPLIIGSDGDKSVVRKALLGDEISPKAYCVALRAYYNGISELHPENYIELHYLPELLPGYFWIFPLPNGMANVGVGMLSAWIRKKKINLRETMLNAIRSNPHLRDRFANSTLMDTIHGWGIPMFIKQRRVSGDNFILTGDAASLVDPFTGEGIGNAMYSGMLAAQAASQALQADAFDTDFMEKNYEAKLFGKIGAELKTSVLLQRLCHYPWLFRFVAHKAYKSPTLNRALQAMFTGVNLRQELRKPSFYINVLLNR